jgi:uncharacterized protein (DUF58 family)
VEDSQKYFDPRTLARLQGLRLRARHIVEGFVAGLHRSPFRGYSIEFSEHRDYVPGDDLRYLDWKVLGRSDRVVVKQFEDETNLVCYLLLDVSESMEYQGPDSAMSKLEYAQCAAATLAYLVLLGQDAASVLTFDDQIRAYAPAASHAEQLRLVLDVLDGARPRPRSASIGPALHDAALRLRRRGVAVLLSDLLDDPQQVLAGLRQLRMRRHDLIVMHLVDPAEMDFPFRRPTLFKGLEAAGDLSVDAAALRRAYLREVEDHLRTLRQGCLAEGADYCLLRTDQPLDVTLSTYLSHRAHRVR